MFMWEICVMSLEGDMPLNVVYSREDAGLSEFGDGNYEGRGGNMERKKGYERRSEITCQRGLVVQRKGGHELLEVHEIGVLID